LLCLLHVIERRRRMQVNVLPSRAPLPVRAQAKHLSVLTRRLLPARKTARLVHSLCVHSKNRTRVMTFSSLRAHVHKKVAGGR